jgi:hypothetical protein
MGRGEGPACRRLRRRCPFPQLFLLGQPALSAACYAAAASSNRDSASRKSLISYGLTSSATFGRASHRSRLRACAWPEEKKDGAGPSPVRDHSAEEVSACRLNLPKLGDMRDFRWKWLSSGGHSRSAQVRTSLESAVYFVVAVLRWLVS